MGQAVVDLPDPLENGDVAKAASADDLLAQLASEEIDRLLAEADEETVPLSPMMGAAPPAPGPDGLPLPPLDTPPAVELPDWLTDELPPASQLPPDFSQGLPPAAQSAAPAAAAPAIAPSRPTVASAADSPRADIAPPLSSAAAALSAELDADESIGTQLSSFAPTPIEAPAPIARAVHSSDAPARASATAPPTDTAAKVRATPAPGTSAEPGDDAEVQVPGPAAWTPGRLPLILKPLEWINAPLDLCPENVREMVGKIAILTMVNAAAVLAYVWMFRRHH